MVDRLTRAFYEKDFEIAYVSKRGNEFQDWFADIMEMRYPSDFKRTYPWGKSGDLKCDGFLPSKRMLFQVYAPNELKERDTLRKIEGDYAGALKYWKRYFDTWVFVHNSKKGLSAKVIQKMEDLKGKRPPDVIHWGYTELHIEVFKLPLDDLRRLFGPAPTVEDMHNFQYENLANVLKYVALKPPAKDPDIHPVTFKKLNANGLSDDSKDLIKLGNRKSLYVGEFFKQWHNPTYGDEVSASFKQEYIRLKNEGLLPEEIFANLLLFTGASRVTHSRDRTAVYALIAYLFWACDIFERPIDD